MIATILEFKWHILLFTKMAGWILTFLVFFARYFFQSKRFTGLFAGMMAMSDYLPSLMLSILDVFYTKSFKEWVYGGSLLFILVNVALFVFSITVGKKWVILLDRKIMGFTTDLKTKYRHLILNKFPLNLFWWK